MGETFVCPHCGSTKGYYKQKTTSSYLMYVDGVDTPQETDKSSYCSEPRCLECRKIIKL